MAKLLLFLSVFFMFTLAALAQPTLSNTSLGFGQGVSVNGSYIQASSVQPGNAGANQTWDFSNAVVDSSQTVDMVAANQAPGGAAYAALGATVSLPQLYGADIVDAFYARTASELVYYGYRGQFMVLGSTTTFEAEFTDPEEVVTLPIGFSEVQTDGFSGTYETNTGGFISAFNRSGTITSTYDAYGTLILASGTFNDVIRLNYNENYQDSPTTPGTPAVQYISENYLWIRDGDIFPLFQYSTLNIGGNPTSYAIMYETLSTNVAERPSLSALTVVPNPLQASGLVSFSLSAPTTVKMEIINLMGKTVMTKTMQALSAGPHTLPLNVESLPAGVYMVQLTSDQGPSTVRMVVR